MQPMHILVTGGHGWIGSYTIRQIQRHFPGVVIDAPSRADCDFTDEESVRGLLGNHAYTHVIHALGGRAYDGHAIHVRCTELLCRNLERTGKPVVFVNFGSSGQYAEDPCGARVDETSNQEPVSSNGRHKKMQETIVRESATRGVVRPVYLRIFNVIGPGQPQGYVVPRLVETIHTQAGSGSPLVWERGEETRDYVDVRDVARAVCAGIGPSPPLGGAFNVCSGNETSLASLAVRVAETMGYAVSWRFVEGPDGRDRIRRQVGDPAKIREILGWRPQVTLSESIRDYVRGLNP